MSPEIKVCRGAFGATCPYDHSLLWEPVLKSVPTGLSLTVLKVPAGGTASEQVRALLLATLQTDCLWPRTGPGRALVWLPETGSLMPCQSPFIPSPSLFRTWDD